jgi:CreA protein
MRKSFFFTAVVAGLLASSVVFAQSNGEIVGSVSTTFRLMGPNDKINIQAYSDPDLPGVTCHLSSVSTGGIGGAVGLAEDGSDNSIACRQTGPIDLAAVEKLPKQSDSIFSESKSVFFKKLKVVRMYDKPNKTLIYLAYSTKLIDGSPKHSISSIPLYK